MVACNIAAMGEALVLATKAGLDPEVVFNAVKGGLAGSTVLNAKAPMVYSRNFKPGFRIRLHQKDLRNALLAGESMQVPLPLTSMVQQMLITLMNEGKGDLDHSAIVNYIERMAAVEVKKPSQRPESRNSLTFRAGHPGWLRCFSLTYSRYARSSRLAIRAPRSGNMSPTF